MSPEEATDPAAPAAKPKRTSKPKAAPAPAAKPDKKERKRSPDAPPVQTLERTIAALGEDHADALATLSRRDPLFKAGLRAEMNQGGDKAECEARIAKHEAALAAARAELAKIAAPATVFRDRLDRLAKSIATERLALPE